MKPIKSPLILADFAVLECMYSFIPSENPKAEFSGETFDKYELDIDYSISDREDLVRVFMTIKVNAVEKPLDGYSIVVKAAGLFKFTLDTPDEEKAGYGGSLVSITINNIRSFMMNLTGCCPYGRYVFPSIDLSDLLTQRINKAEREKAAKPSRPRKAPKKKSEA